MNHVLSYIGILSALACLVRPAWGQAAEADVNPGAESPVGASNLGPTTSDASPALSNTEAALDPPAATIAAASAQEPPASSKTSIPGSLPPTQTEPQDSGPPTLLGGKKIVLGGYGGIAVHASSMKGRGVVYVGGEGALLLDHRFAVGLAGYGLVSNVAGPDNAYLYPQRLAFGYGGVILRYNFVQRQPYYFSAGILVGGGGVAYAPDYEHDHIQGDRIEHADAVFVTEPGISGHLNITRFMRVGVDVSYRVVSGVDDVPWITDKDLAGFAYGGNVQLGWF